MKKYLSRISNEHHGRGWALFFIILTCISYFTDSYDLLALALLIFGIYKLIAMIKSKSRRKRPRADDKSELSTTGADQSIETLDLKEESEFMDYGFFEPRYEFATALEYKDKLAKVRQEQKQAVRDKTAVNYFSNWTVDGSKRKGQKMVNGAIKIIIRCFNSESEAAINKLTFKNYERTADRIRSSHKQLNAAFETMRVAITETYLDLKLDELELAYSYQRKKEEEKEALREQREKEREERALQKEIKDKKEKLAKDAQHRINMINELKAKLDSLTDDEEKQTVVEEIKRLEDNLEAIQNEEKDLDYRLQNVGAGYVYIISNIGSFGKDIVKIGVTRRLDPYERISELSSASVPFAFDVHAMIFSYNAYELETQLHHKFANHRVNMVNNRKEFFKIPIEKIEEELSQYKDLTIDFQKDPTAEEYYQTAAYNKQNEAK